MSVVRLTAPRRAAHRLGALRLPTLTILLTVATFALFALTAGPLVGYEMETAAVSQGLVQTGRPQVLPGNDLGATGTVGRNGILYGRAGLTQPVLESPIYWLGEQAARLVGHGEGSRVQTVALDLYEPAMAALTVAAIFVLLLLHGAPRRRALLVAGLCAVGTLIWPYSKIGMDTTPMAMLALTALATTWAARRPSAARFALIGVGLALTLNAKSYVGMIALGLIPLVAGPWWRQTIRGRLRCAAALAAPLVLGLAVAGWYNWYRTGSVTNFGDPFVTQRLLAMPFSALGLLISPGKGLVFYSPLVVLGALGLRELWRIDRPLAAAIIATTTINIVFISTSWAWTDETWGPRYLVESAWMLVLPLAWWTRGRGRRRWVAGVSVVAILVQFVGIFASYGAIIPAERTLAGEPVYLYGTTGNPHVAYGDDGPRWIPQASPLLLQTEIVVAYLKQRVTGSGFEVTYNPWRSGSRSVLDLRHPQDKYGPLPDFWWTLPDSTGAERLAPLGFALLCVACLVPLVGSTRALTPPAVAIAE